METDASFGRAASIIVLNAVTEKDSGCSALHTYRDLKCKLAQRPAQHFANIWFQVKQFGNTVELVLCHFEGVYAFSHAINLLGAPGLV
jgi:hypothetical protein